jgi:hypothetical protein
MQVKLQITEELLALWKLEPGSSILRADAMTTAHIHNILYEY